VFSLYEGEINNNTPTSTIDINSLVEIIKTNPYNKDFTTLRKYNKGEHQYDEGKKSLIRCHPNCVVTFNSLKDDNFDRNYIQGSGYIYLDIDSVEYPEHAKEQFINQFGNKLAMVCISSGGRGLSILVKINHQINSKCHFKEIVRYIKDIHFPGVDFDKNTDKLNTMWFISYDQNVYYNPNSIIDVSSVKECVDQGILHNSSNTNTLYYAEDRIKKISINMIDSNIDTSTPYHTNKQIEINPIDWIDIKLPRQIKVGYRQRTFTSIIHRLFYLNPGVDPIWIFAYLYNVNKNCSEEEWRTYRDMLALFNFNYNIIKGEDYTFEGSRTKSIHFSPDLDITGSHKCSIANKLNGKIKSNNSKLKIAAAIKQLRQEGKKETVTAIHKLSGVSRKTVGIHLKDLEITNLDDYINDILDNL
jgi:hypothetical protein